jgi:HK97 family phage major capsid protein
MATDELDRLVGQKNHAFEEAKRLLDHAESEKRSLSAEENTQLERMNADIDSANATIAARIDFEQRAAENAVAAEAWSGIVRPADEARKADGPSELERFVAGELRSFELDLAGAAREKRAIRSGLSGQELRVATVGTAASGGTTVPTSFSRELYDYLEVYSGMRRTNATILTTASGENIDMPKVVSQGTAAVVGEGTALAAVDPSFSKLTLGSWKYGQLLQISNELASDSGVDILGFIAKDCGRAIARVTDTQYVIGTGSTGPLGVMVAAGTGVTGGTGLAGVPTLDNLIDLYYSVNEEYRMNGAQWLMKDATAGAIRKVKTTDGQYLWQPSVVAGTPDRLLNAEVISDPNVVATALNANSVGFGDFSTYIIRDVGTVRFERSDDFAFDKDLITYRCVFRTDGDLIDLTGAIKVFKGGTA